MAKKKKTEFAEFYDGWQSLAVETVAKFAAADRKGFDRLLALGKEKFGLDGDTLPVQLALCAFDPRTIATASRSPYIIAATAGEFDATINLLEFCRKKFGNLIRTGRGRVRLQLTGTALQDQLRDYKDGARQKKLEELFETRIELRGTRAQNYIKARSGSNERALAELAAFRPTEPMWQEIANRSGLRGKDVANARDQILRSRKTSSTAKD